MPEYRVLVELCLSANDMSTATMNAQQWVNGYAAYVTFISRRLVKVEEKPEPKPVTE